MTEQAFRNHHVMAPQEVQAEQQKEVSFNDDEEILLKKLM